MKSEKSKVIHELNALIDQAWGYEKFVGEKEGFSIKQDPGVSQKFGMD